VNPEPAVALVTGSTSGIGEAVVRRLAREGYHVVVNSRSSVEAGAALAREVGGSYVQADVADEGQARSLVAEVLTDHGRLDVLVNNAGTTVKIPHADLESATAAVWRSIYETNVIGPWTVTVAAVPALRAAHGCVVNMGSLAGLRPLGSSIPYASSKAALHHQSLLLANTLGPEIRVNAVAPGFIETPWTQDWDNERAGVGALAPLRRPGLPEDVAEVVMGLVRSTYVTGQVIAVDGGLGLR
jgi:NAD(P)-dependent dehydrogenase (short-subunit alcohol dehydrogenase family)